MKTILTVLGTRPEVIKMAKLIDLLNKDQNFIHKVCVTGQHKELLFQALNIFNIVPDFDLKVMSHNQSLTDVTSKILLSFTEVLIQLKPDLILVHGDTTTSFACSLAAFYQKIAIGHVEAGLRSKNKYNPFPEEINRVLVSKLAFLHFAPTKLNYDNLISEGILEDNIFITGNTVIDTLLDVSSKLLECPDDLKNIEEVINTKFILVTGHRRENFGKGFSDISDALIAVAKKYPLCNIIYPLHLNPNVREVMINNISGIKNIHLIEPLPYLSFIYLMKKCELILTDSGGIQEEAPSLNKPVLVMRECTERTEALSEKTAELVGTNPENIINAISKILDGTSDIVIRANPYGDGFASEKIINLLRKRMP